MTIEEIDELMNKHLQVCGEQDKCVTILCKAGIFDLRNETTDPGVAFRQFSDEHRFCLACCVRVGDRTRYRVMGLSRELDASKCGEAFAYLIKHLAESLGTNVELRIPDRANN